MQYERHCAEIVVQTELLVTGIEGADLRAPVLSCPGWTLGMLLRHIGGGHRWAENIVRTRSGEFLPDDEVRNLGGDDSGEVPADRLRADAARLTATLRAAGPDAQVWTPLDRARSTSFWARRFAHETLIHRADATLAAGTGFTVAEDVALDAVDEWLELDALPQHFAYKPRKRELLGPGRTLALQATDTDAAWFVDLTGEVITWQRADRPAAATVRAPLADLLLVIYLRKPLADRGIEIIGDEDLLARWTRHVAFA